MLAAQPVAILDCFLHANMGCSSHVYYFLFDIKGREPPSETETGDRPQIRPPPPGESDRPLLGARQMALVATAGGQTASK